MTKLRKKILTGSVIFFILSGVNAILNYGLYPVIARITSVATFGEIQFFINLANQLGIAFVVLNILSIIITARENNKKRAAAERDGLEKLSNLIVLAVVAIGSALLIAYRQTFHIESIWSIIILGISLIINIPYTIELGRLQGEGHFAFSGVIGVIASLGRLFFAVSFILLGFGAFGAILGITFGVITAYIVALIASRSFSEKRSYFHRYFKDIEIILPHYKLILTTLFSIFTISTLSVIDVFITKSALSHFMVGQYGGISTLAKVVLAMATPIIWLGIPAIINNSVKIVRRYLYTIIALMFLAASIILTFHMFILRVGFNSTGIILASYLPIELASVAIFALVMFLCVVSICRNRLIDAVIISIILMMGFIVSYSILGSSPVIYRTLVSEIIAGSVALLWLVVANFKYIFLTSDNQ